MSNLRSLLSYSGEASSQNLPQGCAWYHLAICHQCGFNAVHDNCCTAWVAPPAGLACCTATIEIWGAGGGGAGSCCCMGGPPGGSGAYSKKTISIIPCACYYTCLGIGSDCACGSTGQRGSTTSVVGPFLNVCGTTCATTNADNRQFVFGTSMNTIGMVGATVQGTGIPGSTTITAVNCMLAPQGCISGQVFYTGALLCSGTPVVGMCLWSAMPAAPNVGGGGACFSGNTYICCNITGTGVGSQWGINQNFTWGPAPIYGFAATLSQAATATNSNNALYCVSYGAPYCLNNFCAEGGYGGCSYCNPACCFSYCTCSPGGSGAVTASATAGNISGTTFTAGGTVTGSFGLNYVLTGTGVTAGTTIIGCTNTTTWTVDRTQTTTATAITGTAPLLPNAYGGDINIQGVKGCYYHICCDNACWNKHFIPFPAGLVNQCGGVTVMGITGSGYAETGYCVAASQIGWSTQNSQYVPGIGGVTHYVTGQSCAQGQPGRPGMIKITYR